MDIHKKTIVLGISSGIAAHKVLELIDKLRQDGSDVTVIMTQSACSMISVEEVEKVSGNTVYTSLFPQNFDREKILKERIVDHIEVAKKADLLVIAPATANTIAKIANGIADDFLTTTLLATLAPVLICPSMNTNMWYHPAVQENITKLQNRGYSILYPESGELACGTEGVGRLAAVESIHKEIKSILETSQRLAGKKIIVTAGGSQEPIDDVRVITNKSSGKMGVAIAEECYRQGAEVLLLRSTTAVQTNLPLKQELFESAGDLEKLIKDHVRSYDMIFHVAALSDYTVDKTKGKIDSKNSLTLELRPTTKIINEIKIWNPKIKLIGFKAVSNVSVEELKVKSLSKLQKSHADYIVANDVGKKEIGFNSDDNEVYIFSNNEDLIKIDRVSKKHIAKKIVDYIPVS